MAAYETVETVLDKWLTPALKPSSQLVTLFGYILMHGGDWFMAPTRITAKVEATLAELILWLHFTIRRL